MSVLGTKGKALYQPLSLSSGEHDSEHEEQDMGVDGHDRFESSGSSAMTTNFFMFATCKSDVRCGGDRPRDPAAFFRLF